MIRALIVTIIVIAAVVAAGGAILLAADSDARYDSNRDGMISAQEARDGVRDYFAGEIGQDAAVDLMLRNFAGVPVAIPTQSYSPTPTPTPTPTVSIPGMPRITGITPGDAGFAVQWARVAGQVSAYGVAWRVLPDGEWEHASRPGTVLSHSVWDLKNGVSYAVFVQAINAAGYGEWSNGVTVTPSGAPTPTRTPSPTPTSTPVVATERTLYCDGRRLMTITNPEPPTTGVHDSSVRWRVTFSFWEQDSDYMSDKTRNMLVAISNDGQWSLKVYGSTRGTYTVDSGTVSVNRGWNARNEVGVATRNHKPLLIKFRVNGVEHFVDMDDEDRRVIWSTFTPYETLHGDTYIKVINGKGQTIASGNAGFHGDMPERKSCRSWENGRQT